MKKYLLILFTMVLCIPTMVYAASIDELKETKTYTFKSIPPTDEDESWVVFEKFYEEYDHDLDNCNETYTVCDVLKYGEVVISGIQLNYDYDKAFKTEVDKIIKDIPTKYYFTDVEYMSYLLYGYKHNTYEEGTDDWNDLEEKNISVRYNYSTGLRKALNYKNFVIHPGMGYDEVLASYVQGYGFVEYDGIGYGILKDIGVYSPHVIYLDTNTTDIVKAIKDRFTSIFGSVMDDVEIAKATSVYSEISEENYTSVTDYIAGVTAELTNEYNTYIDDLSQFYNGVDDFISQVAPEIEFIQDAEEDFYSLTINGEKWYFVVILDSSKVNNDLSLVTSDVKTDISISTNSSNVPLDAMIQAKQVNKDLKDKLGTDDYYVYDISLYSNALSNYITKLTDGTFKVSIPVPDSLNGKDLIVYYINSEGNKEEHKVTVKNGYAEFTTNHFSEYVLTTAPTTSENVANNPATLDDILMYVGIMAVSAVGIILIAKHLKKKNN